MARGDGPGRRTVTRVGIAAATAYIGTVLTANYATAAVGQVPLWFGMSATAGTLFIGAALLLRNVIQDKLGRRVVVAAIAVGSVSSAVVSPELALASGAAFLLSESLDMAVYTPLRSRGYVRAVVPAGFVGAVADTVVFLYLAGFPVVENMAGQISGKYVVTLATVAGVALVRVRRAEA